MFVCIFKIKLLSCSLSIKDNTKIKARINYFNAYLQLNIQVIVCREKWLWSLANMKGANNTGKSATMYNLSFSIYTLCRNYLTKTIQLVISSARSKQLLLCWHTVKAAKREQKPTTKKFVCFHNHSPPWTMFKSGVREKQERWILKCLTKDINRHLREIQQDLWMLLIL